jgi:DNA repair protein RadA/Sms
LGEDVFVNLAGGLYADEPGIDLAIAAAIVSSFRECPIDPGVVAFGEVGLAGEVRSTASAALRLKECQALGFRRCLMPEGNLAGLEAGAVELLGARFVGDGLERIIQARPVMDHHD